MQIHEIHISDGHFTRCIEFHLLYFFTDNRFSPPAFHSITVKGYNIPETSSIHVMPLVWKRLDHCIPQ